MYKLIIPIVNEYPHVDCVEFNTIEAAVAVQDKLKHHGISSFIVKDPPMSKINIDNSALISQLKKG